MVGSTKNLGFLLNRPSFRLPVAGSALVWAFLDRFNPVPKILGPSKYDFEVFVAISGCVSIILSHFKPVLAGLRVSGSGSL